jgi:hypothetical protein
MALSARLGCGYKLKEFVSYPTDTGVLMRQDSVTFTVSLN